MNQSPGSFVILDRQPDGVLDTKWRACLAASEFPTHYTAPEYFLEPSLRCKRPFAVLSFAGEDVTGVLTGVHEGDRVQSGISVRPQIAFSRTAERAGTMGNLVTGLLSEASVGKLVDLFVWSDMAALVGQRFRQRLCEGVVLLDLSSGPEVLFRKFSDNKRTNIKKAIRYGVSVAAATGREELSAYYSVCIDWCHRKGLPIITEEEFQQTFELTDNRILFLARHQGQIIAGVVIRFFPNGVMEYAANASLECALRLRPNDLLHWRAIEWGCQQGMTAYSLGGTHLFLRKFGGEILPTTRCRLDLSMFRRYAIGDWLSDQARRTRPLMPDQLAAFARSVRGLLDRPRARRLTNGA
jgi:hypothetical protein